MGYQCFARHEVVAPARVHQAESGKSAQLASGTVRLRDSFRDGERGARTALEDAAANILEAAVGISERDHRMTGCFDSVEDRNELATA